MTPPRRALAVAGLLALLLGALLVAWFAAGWSDVRGRQRAQRDAPRLAAEQRGAQLAHALRGELSAVMAREVERPYFHYQNLFHDPRASAGPSVAPSPLAAGPDDALVLGYFQIDAGGRTTTPTINDELPELSEPKRLADHRRFRDDVARNLAAAIMPAGRPDAVASGGAGAQIASRSPKPSPPAARPAPAVAPAAARPAPPVSPPAAQPAPPASPPAAQPVPETVPAPSSPRVADSLQQAQVIQLDRNSYVQNNASNQIYLEQQRAEPPRLPADKVAADKVAADKVAADKVAADKVAADKVAADKVAADKVAADKVAADKVAADKVAADKVTADKVSADKVAADKVAADKAAADNTPPAIRPSAPRSRPTASRAAPTPAPTAAAPIAITVSPLEWRTLAFTGQPTVVAVRQVETPDGRLVQGFVVDRSALTSWLAGHAGDAVAELRTGDNGSTEIVPGWHLEVTANPRAVVAADAAATGLARGFVLRFIATGAVAIIAAWFVVLLVVRSERLARERSQFAAAAAHELRTPLAGLQLYGDMLADGLGDPAKLRDYARRMSEEAARLGRVVSNVLGFSQLERGNLSVEPRSGALDEALRELAERAQPALDRAGATLALDVAPELSATFDRDALVRIVGNLLDNAEKYGRESGDRTIHLAARPAGSGVEVVVSDRGPGVAAQLRARLFQPFARGVSGDGPAGLGLGLALSQSLARAMGGELAYRPAPGGGAAFVLTLGR